MRIKAQHNKLKLICVTLVVLVCSILVECLGFNFEYWTSKQASNQTLMSDDSKILLHDIKYKEGSFRIVGEEPYIKIDVSGYCNYLKINIDNNIQDYKIIAQHFKNGQVSKSQEHTISNIYKNNAIIEVKDDLENVLFIPEVPENMEQNEEFIINSFSINNTFIVNYYRIGAMFCSAMLILIFVFLRKKICKRLHIVFLLIVVFLGINISIINAVNHSYDEREHFLRAYEVSNFDFGLSENINIPWIENSDDFIQKARLTYSEVSYQNIAERNEYMKLYGSTEYNHRKTYDSTASTYLFIPYIPGAIGIFVGRMIGLPFIWTFYFGRITSLLGYAIICTWCIKHIKYGQRLMFAIALLPALLLIATSYSADTYTLAFSFMVLTIWINILVQKEKIRLSQIIGFMISVIIVTMCKVTYVPLCLLFLAIPLDKFVSKMQCWFSKILIILGSGMFSVCVYLYSNMKDMNQWQMPGVDVSGQIKYIFMHPLTYLYTICNDVACNAINYMTGITNNLAYNEAMRPIWAIFLILVLVGVALIDNESRNFVFRKKEKIMLVLSVICSWGLVATALYITFTPLGSDAIQGIQGRYWGPLLVPLLLLLKNKWITCSLKEETINYILSWSMMIPVMISLWTILNYCCG